MPNVKNTTLFNQKKNVKCKSVVWDKEEKFDNKEGASLNSKISETCMERCNLHDLSNYSI